MPWHQTEERPVSFINYGNIPAPLSGGFIVLALPTGRHYTSSRASTVPMESEGNGTRLIISSITPVRWWQTPE